MDLWTLIMQYGRRNVLTREQHILLLLLRIFYTNNIASFIIHRHNFCPCYDKICPFLLYWTLLYSLCRISHVILIYIWSVTKGLQQTFSPLIFTNIRDVRMCQRFMEYKWQHYVMKSKMYDKQKESKVWALNVEWIIGK